MVKEFSDLSYCLEYNPQQGFLVSDIAEVLAEVEGQNDGEDWYWILRLHDGRFVYLQGGCDYTGWDCQSWASSHFAESAAEAARFAHDMNVDISRSSPRNAGIGHMLNLLSGDYKDQMQSAYVSLMRQLEHGKDQTWRERLSKEMLGGDSATDA